MLNDVVEERSESVIIRVFVIGAVLLVSFSFNTLVVVGVASKLL